MLQCVIGCVLKTEKKKWYGHCALRIHTLERQGWLLMHASCGNAWVSVAQKSPMAGLLLCCCYLDILNFCTWNPVRQRSMHIRARVTWKEGKYILVPKWQFLPALFLYIFVLPWAPWVIYLVLQPGVWTCKPIALVDHDFLCERFLWRGAE